MRKLNLLVLFIFLSLSFCFSSVSAIEDDFSLKSLSEDSHDFEAHIEYNEKDKAFFDMLKNDLDIASFSVKNLKNVNFEEIKNRSLAKKHISSEYTIDEIYADYSEKSGNFTYGTTYSADIDTGEFEYNTKFYTRYDNKLVGFMTAYGKDRYTSSGIQRDFIYFTPEIKLGKGFVLKDDLRISVSGINKKNEIVIKYTPPKHDRFGIEFGLGQVLYRDGNKQNVLRFGTTLRL